MLKIFEPCRPHPLQHVRKSLGMLVLWVLKAILLYRVGFKGKCFLSWDRVDPQNMGQDILLMHVVGLTLSEIILRMCIMTNLA